MYYPASGAEERLPLLGNAESVLMPTYYLEPFGGVHVEAQLCDTPVITTDWSAFPPMYEEYFLAHPPSVLSRGYEENPDQRALSWHNRYYPSVPPK